MTSNTASAHPHATGVAMYPALFQRMLSAWYIAFPFDRFSYDKLLINDIQKLLNNLDIDTKK